MGVGTFSAFRPALQTETIRFFFCFFIFLCWGSFPFSPPGPLRAYSPFSLVFFFHWARLPSATPFCFSFFALFPFRMIQFFLHSSIVHFFRPAGLPCFASFAVSITTGLCVRFYLVPFPRPILLLKPPTCFLLFWAFHFFLVELRFFFMFLLV